MQKASKVGEEGQQASSTGLQFYSEAVIQTEVVMVRWEDYAHWPLTPPLSLLATSLHLLGAMQAWISRCIHYFSQYCDKIPGSVP